MLIYWHLTLMVFTVGLPQIPLLRVTLTMRTVTMATLGHALMSRDASSLVPYVIPSLVTHQGLALRALVAGVQIRVP